MEQRWIPVSERLPEDNIIRVWLSFTNQYASYVKSAFWNGSYFEHANGKKVKDKPTAWKKYSPPEPYCEGERKQTNADRIRNLTDEELAILIINFDNTFGEEYEGEQNFLSWLQKESEE